MNTPARHRPCGARRLVAAALLTFCLLAAASAQSGPTYENPVIEGDHPDPSVVRAGDDYWAAVTTGNWAPHFTLLHSRDLVNWRTVGAVFQKAPAWVKGDFWAPEITEDRGRFFVYYTARRDEGPKKTGTLCVAVATAARAEGPYTDHGPLVCEIRELKNVGSIDAYFVRDETGQPHLVWKADGNDAEPDVPTSIFAQRLSEDGTKLLGRRREILRNTAPWERHVTEGSFILHRGEWFYHFYSGNACCGRGCDYALGVARARKLLGPWEKNPNNPVIAANQAWQCPGHGSIATTPAGRTYLLYHSYRRRPDTFAVGREALLDEIEWGADGWPTVNRGKGPSLSAPAPLGVAESPDETEFVNEFKAEALEAGWQWPMNKAQTARTGSGGGLLLLSVNAGAAPADEWTAAVLGRRISSGSYTATAVIDARGLTKGARAGLSAFSWRAAAAGIATDGAKVYVWRREGKRQETLAALDAAASPTIHLRMTAEGGETYRFAFSTDGGDWREAGGAVAGSHIEGARLALTVGGPPGSAGAFDSLRVNVVSKK